MKPKRDELLDHDVDGIREFDNALPRWWLYGFYFTIVIAAVYLVNYHVLSTPVLGEQTLVAEYNADVAAARRLHPERTTVATTEREGGAGVFLEDAASLAKGKAIFEGTTNPCQVCHRPDLGGLVGPNLTDDLWIHGCSSNEIAASIRTGFPDRGMPPFGGGPALDNAQLLELASFIRSKHASGPANPKPVDPEREKHCG